MEDRWISVFKLDFLYNSPTRIGPNIAYNRKPINREEPEHQCQYQDPPFC